MKKLPSHEKNDKQGNNLDINVLSIENLDRAINSYIYSLPQYEYGTWFGSDLQVVFTYCKRPRKDKKVGKKGSYVYNTLMKCPVGGADNVYPFPGQSLMALRSQPKDDMHKTAYHRMRKKKIGPDDAGLVFVLAGIIVEFYSRAGFRTLNNGHHAIPVLSDDAILFLEPLIKRLLKESIETTLYLSKYEGTSPYATAEEFKTDVAVFKQYFFYGPEYGKGPPDEDFQHIQGLWNTKRLHPLALEKLKQIICSETQSSCLERDQLIESIMIQAMSIPLVATLNIPGKYLELHDLLRQITRFESEEKNEDIRIIAKVKPPLPIITDAILRPLYDNLRNKNYTGYDYILAHGEIASVAREDKNHSFFKSKLDPKLQSFVDDAREFKLLVEVDESGDHFKYRTKQHRLFVSAMAIAIKSNQEYFESPFFDRISAGIDVLLAPSRSKMVQSGLAKAHYSGRAWFSVVFLEYIEAVQRKVLIVELEKIANNFDSRALYRERQEKCLSIGSYLLLEKFTEYPRKFTESMFLSFFGRTLYAAQAEMWPLLRDSSGIFADMAKKWFREACISSDDSESKKTNIGNENETKTADAHLVPAQSSFENPQEEKNTLLAQTTINPDKQPYFNFLQGDLYTDDELENLEPSLQFAVSSCRLQKITWYLTSEQERQSISFNVVDKIFELLKSGLKEIEKSEPAGNMGFVIGVSMLLYSIANIMNRRTEFPNEVQAVEKAVQDIHTHDVLIKSILLSDYYSRRENRRYAKQEDGCHIVCGGIRAVCAMEIGGFERFPVKYYLDSLGIPAINAETLKKDYQRWINFHLGELGDSHSENNRPRQAFLIYRMLSYYDFGNENTFEEFLRSKRGIKNLYKDFLPYDQMCDDFGLFYKNPKKVWTEEAKAQYKRA